MGHEMSGVTATGAYRRRRIVTPLLRRVGPGKYRVPSETMPGRFYSVQVHDGRASCNCLGAERAERTGGTCKHGRASIAAEEKYMSDNGTQDTALAVREQVAIEYNPSLPTMDDLKVMVTIANSVHKTAGQLIPASIKTSEAAFAIMLAGRELGLGPMESFREIYVIQGVTVPSYRVLLAMLFRGDPTARIEWIERSAERACARLSRAGHGVIEVEYTMADAKRAGLATKDNYQKHPKDMLAARVVTRLCKLGGPDLITSIGASVKHAPAVMRVIDDAIDADADEIPAMVTSTVVDEPPPPAEQPAKVRLGLWLKQQRQELPLEQFGNIVKGINQAYPGALTASGETVIGGKGALDDAKAQAILDGLAAPTGDDAPPHDDGDQGELV